jgi:hypothetical protein
MNAKLKIFVMAVIGFVVTTLSTIEVFDLAYVALVTVSFALTYALKNLWFPSNSNEGSVVWKDIVSGVILAVSMALSTYAAAIILPEVEFSFKVMWMNVIGAVVGYFTKTVAQGQKVSTT